MPNSPVLDTAAAVAVSFFVVALASSAVVEFISNLVSKRAKYLLRGLRDLLDAPTAPAAPVAPTMPTVRPKPARKTQRVATLRRGVAAETALYGAALAAGPATSDLKASSDQGLSRTVQLMGHPLVSAFKQTGASGDRVRNPSYLPSSTFATALIDILVPDRTGQLSLDRIAASIRTLDDGVPFVGAVESLLTAAQGDVTAFRVSLERWYDNEMARIAGSYKRWAKRWLIVVTALVAIGFQVDTIAIANQVYADGPLQQAVVAAAENKTLCQAGPAASPTDTAGCVAHELSSLHTQSGLPLGWSGGTTPTSVGGWLAKVLGWALTVFAASFGAPFWFDALSKLGSLRNAGPRPATTT